MKRIAILIAQLAATVLTAQLVLVKYFSRAGCKECEKVNAFVLPRLEEQYCSAYNKQ